VSVLRAERVDERQVAGPLGGQRVESDLGGLRPRLPRVRLLLTLGVDAVLRDGTVVPLLRQDVWQLDD
jgi:hypothetical protein